jgi:hypothetical protein
MARRSLRDLLRKRREDKKALSPEMRTLLDGFEAQYGTRRDQRAEAPSTDRESRVSGRG